MSKRNSPGSDLDARHASLQHQVEDLEAMGRIWMRSGEVKDRRIADLEEHVRVLELRLARLSRIVSRRRRAQNPDRRRKLPICS